MLCNVKLQFDLKGEKVVMNVDFLVEGRILPVSAKLELAFSETDILYELINVFNITENRKYDFICDGELLFTGNESNGSDGVILKEHKLRLRLIPEGSKVFTTFFDISEYEINFKRNL